MLRPLHFLLATLVVAALLVPVTSLAQDGRNNRDDDEDVIERDGARIIIQDRDGNRSRVRMNPNRRGDRSGVVVFRSDDGETYRFEIDGDEIYTDDDIDFERDGDTIRFTTPDGEEHEIQIGPNRFHFDGEGANVFFRGNGENTFFGRDGQNVFQFRSPDGDERVFEFQGPDMERFHFEMPDLPGVSAFAMPDFYMQDGEMPFQFERMFDGLRGLDSEARREMMERERRSAELAMQLRRAEGGERAELEAELDALLDQLFEMRGEMREERARALDERAQELREEAEELREALRERQQQRRALIEQRKRELLGERGSDW